MLESVLERSMTERPMTDEEKHMYDFVAGEQWTPEQIEQMKRRVDV